MMYVSIVRYLYSLDITVSFSNILIIISLLILYFLPYFQTHKEEDNEYEYH